MMNTKSKILEWPNLNQSKSNYSKLRITTKRKKEKIPTKSKSLLLDNMKLKGIPETSLVLIPMPNKKTYSITFPKKLKDKTKMKIIMSLNLTMKKEMKKIIIKNVLPVIKTENKQVKLISLQM